MKNTLHPVSKFISILIGAALILGLFQWRALQSLKNQNYYEANFFVFWLSGKLILDGQSPYNPEHWANGHDHYGQVTPREPTFLYPLPLAVLLAPLGLLNTGQAYYLWQWISQLAMAVTIFFLLNRWHDVKYLRLFVPMVFFITFFGPSYLTLQIGSIGPITLVCLLGALHFLDKDRFFLAGGLLALTLLKPSQGATLLLLLGLVLLARKQWKVFAGLAAGGVLLLLLGLIADPHWVETFLASSEAAFDRRLGAQSNIWSFSFIACQGTAPCYTISGAISMILILGGTALYLWHNHQELNYWQIFNLILPVAFVSTLYLWAYDQILYILPIVWVTASLLQKRQSYLWGVAFLILLDVISLMALYLHAATNRDIWSIANTMFILAALFIVQKLKPLPHLA